MRRRFWPKTASFTFHSTISQDKRHLGFSQFHTGADKTLWLARCCVACCSKPCETCSEAEEKPPVCHWQCSWSAKITIAQLHTQRSCNTVELQSSRSLQNVALHWAALCFLHCKCGRRCIVWSRFHTDRRRHCEDQACKRGGASNSFSMQCCIYAIMLEGSARPTDNVILRGSTVFLNESTYNEQCNNANLLM